MSCLRYGRDETSSGRGLCLKCHKTTAIRCLYQRLPVSSWPGLAADNREPPLLPDQPTEALAGSAENVTVLAKRAARGAALWHPEDARFVVS
jgi:hypothetical protein